MDPLDRDFKKDLLWFFGIGLLIYLVTAYFSVGFFSWDEHYQTLEFLSPRLGRGSVSDLPWEYAQAVRPWFQPAFYYVVIRALRAFGIQNAAIWALVLRLMSGILSWLAMLGMSIVSFRWFRSSQSRRIALALAAFLCFFPFVGVRTSSETLSAASFFLGFAAYFLIPADFWNAVVAGLLMGVALQFRYQDALMVAGFLGYLIYSKDHRSVWRLIAMVALVAVLGICVDCWGYGRWTFVPWNYFRANILEGRANAFSRDPVWFYFARYSELMPPIGALSLLAVLAGWVRKPLHVLTWVTFPFFLAHCLITHKEVRFLFPLLPAVPFLIVFALEGLSEARIRRAWRGLRWILIPANFLLLVIFAFKPAYSPFLLYQYLGDHPEIQTIYYRDEDPFVQIRALQTSFFRAPGTQSVKLATYPQIEKELGSGKALWLFEGAASLPKEAGALRQNCELKFSAFPRWLNALNFIPGIRYANRRSLFLCKPSL